jgi:hypothetical protein
VLVIPRRRHCGCTKFNLRHHEHKMKSTIFSKNLSLSEDEKVSIIKCCWPGARSTNVDDYRSYFGFFYQELRNIYGKGDSSPKFAVQTLEDIKTIVKVISENQGATGLLPQSR